MIVQITQDNEHYIDEAVASGHFSSRDEVLNTAIRLLREDSCYGKHDSGTEPLPVDKWIEQVRAWAASHRRVDYLIDDRRESIYAGRGE